MLTTEEYIGINMLLTLFDTLICLTKVKCLTVSLHSPENGVVGTFSHLYLENSNTQKKLTATYLKTLTERNQKKKIPSKLDEKQIFYVVPKITFLAIWAFCISKTIRD